MANTLSSDMAPRSAFAATKVRSPERVLIVDTDTATLKAVAVALRQDGRAIVTATDGPTALALLRAGVFDLLLADVRVTTPEGDLLSVARQTAPHVMRLALASFSALDMALQALRSGAYHYLVKPIDVEELRLSVTQALERLRLERELAERVAELQTAHNDLLDANARLRDEVDAATDELRHNLDEMESTNELLRQTQSQNQRFIQMVAHELRGPLNPIINYAQLAKRPNITEDERNRFMDTIVEHAFRLNRLVGDLQTATRLSAGQFSLRCEPSDVTTVVAELVAESTAAERDRSFTIDIAEAPIIANVDRDRVGQAVRNLLDNAVKYSVAGGAIETRVWRDDANVYISIGDYGAGIPESEMKRIFEPFIRLDAKASEVSGSGLGLFITRGVISAHGGSLDVRNRGGERASGAIFTISVPLNRPDVASDAAAQ